MYREQNLQAPASTLVFPYKIQYVNLKTLASGWSQESGLTQQANSLFHHHHLQLQIHELHISNKLHSYMKVSNVLRDALKCWSPWPLKWLEASTVIHQLRQNLLHLQVPHVHFAQQLLKLLLGDLDLHLRCGVSTKRSLIC